MHPSAARRRTLVAVAAAAVLAGGSAAALAEPNPFYFRASETLTHDSNIFRVPESFGRTADTISTTELAVGLDQPYGRQRYLANLGISANVFKNKDELNYTGYDLLLGMDWSALDKWSGDLRLIATQALVNYENYGSLFTTSTAKNLERNDELSARAQYGLASLWVLGGTFDHRDVNYSDPLFANREYRQDEVGLFAAYQPTDLTRIGLGVRHTDGRFPNGTSTGPDKFKRDDIDLTGSFKLSGLSTIDARISATRENHTPIDTRDFNGVTGSIGWNYRITGKTTFDLRYTRDTGTRGAGVPTSIDPSVTATYLSDARVADRIDAAVRWEPTAKITVRGGAGYSRDHYDEAFLTVIPLGTSGSTGGDTGNRRYVKVGVAFQATRALSLGCDAERRSRSAPVFVNNVGYNYDANIYGCNVQLMLQ